MADIEPTYYNVAPMDVNGVNQGDILLETAMANLHTPPSGGTT
jgi:hypothetical protein